MKKKQRLQTYARKRTDTSAEIVKSGTEKAIAVALGNRSEREPLRKRSRILSPGETTRELRIAIRRKNRTRGQQCKDVFRRLKRYGNVRFSFVSGNRKREGNQQQREKQRQSRDAHEDPVRRKRTGQR